MTEPAADLAVGTRVHIEREETRYPSRGTWPQFRGRTGTVVEINEDRKRPHLTEYGVIFGKVRHRADRPGSVSAASGQETTTWFKSYELTPVGGVAAQHKTERIAA
ncbi:MAG: hypothetical protein JST91_08610 [Actinobacteria bacterium]|nr:hypothetical protein [Actinomycetota bacterium]